MKRVKIRRLWVESDDPSVNGMDIFEVDPPLEAGEVEINMSDIECEQRGSIAVTREGSDRRA